MVKALLLLAFTAQVILLVSSTDSSALRTLFSKSSSVSSSSSYSYFSSSYKSSGAELTPAPVQHSDCRSCRENEIWVPCPDSMCAPKTCEDVGFPVPCYDLGPNEKCPSPPGCICKEGLVRNSKGDCVPMKYCPSCGGDPNAESGCGTNCNRLCSNYNKENVSCIQECFYNACDCKPGYVFDEIIRKCVLPSNCTPPIKCEKLNEVYDLCPATCPYRTCGINDAAVSCLPALPNGHPDCNPPKCRCEDGFYRDDYGDCVRWEDCPTCTGPNEFYDPCPNPCPPQNCGVDAALILCLEGPQLGDPECDPECRCIDGYVRNYTGVCIPKDQCPKCPGPNMVFDPCIAPCPPRRCDVDERLIKCAPPPKFGDPLCEAGCRCADGYVTNYEGECILKEDCPKCTRPHEIFDPCPKTCPPQTCESLNRTYDCPVEVIQDCDGQCVCEDGYYKNKIGECISKEDCLKCTGPYEYFSCGSACDNVCGLLDQQNQTNCPIVNIVCNQMCYCEEGYARDENNICIPIEDCNVPDCGPNERYEICPATLCQAVNCTQVGFPIACPAIAGPGCPVKPACVCENDYVRNDRGICVPKNQCPSCAGDPNAIAGCGVYCNQLCRDIGKEPGACILICYPNACNCREGYYLDENTGKCVLPKQCTPQCPQNEIYSECIQGSCSPQHCSQLGYLVPCPRINPTYCKKGCLCKEGYVRNDDGVCIPSTDCPSCEGDPNKIAGCGTYCNQRCKDVGLEPGACIAVCYNNACDCRPGFFLDENTGFCVPADKCSSQCPENEWYSECIQGECSPQNCSQLGFAVSCPRIDPKYCNKGCLCDEGLVRNEKGVCIPTTECPSCGGDANKVAGCGVYCNTRCSDIGTEPKSCIAICNENACDCKKGFFLDENSGFCVPPNKCTPQCPENESYSECIQGNCSPQNCTQLGFSIPCPRIDPRYCKKGCLCDDGYSRDRNGICIPSTDCPSCGGDPNAQAGCGGYCNRRCSDIGQEPKACILICQINGCDCKDGYYYDDTKGRCVTPEQCTKTPICLASNNEVCSDCINGGCQAKNCSQYGKAVPCVKINPKYCIKGCLCAEGYLRASNGKCVLERDCPEACNGPNEEYNECSWNCPPQTCESLDRAYACPLQNGENCVPMCRCKPGHFRNKLGQCITEEECRRCSGPYEYFSCGGACDNVCATLDKQSQENCPIINIKCNEMCYCEKGYARARNNTCIPIDSCDEPQCPINERYERCPGASCEPMHCSQLGFSMICPPEGWCPKKPACVCVDGFVRNENGSCIHKNDCPSCGGDPNAISGCGVNCGKECSNVGREDYACIQVCYNNACDCRDGYYFDSKLKKCVRPDQCTNICAKNEVFENCTNSVCKAKNCADLGFPLDCEAPCKKGCVCKDGYLRDVKGRCIPQKNCPSCGGDPNAEPGCGVNCGRRCSDIGKRPVACPLICLLNGCDCKQGYFYDDNTKKCVKKEDCTKICGKNEVFEDCSDPICSAMNCTQLGFPLDCNSGCTKGCVCKEGYARNNKGICIPVNQCPSCGGDPNAKSGCGVNCLKKCYDLQNPGRPRPCPRICYSNACDCKDGYYLDESTNKCVLSENCPSTCGKDEVYSFCINGGCDKKNCTQLGQPQICIDPIKCFGGCICKEGFLRLENGTCVPYDQCPAPTCKKNERYELCPANVCQPQSCSEIGFPIDCPDTGDKCSGYPACICNYGYVRNSNGICRPKSECPSCGGDPNAKSGCGIYCNQRCPNNNLNPKLCPRICLPNACDCKDGFLYDINVKSCVEPKKCSPRCDDFNNEVYDSCVNGGCDWKNCSQVGGPQLCINPIKCYKGCKCKEEYYRLNNGTCVPENKCPINCWGPNEEYVPCPLKCPEPTCENINQKYVCPKQTAGDCVGQCHCKPNFCRNKIGECIRKKDCLKCTGTNEFFSCGPACDNVCSKLDTESQFNCPIKSIKCVPRCYCEKGFARNRRGICIPINKCPGYGSTPTITYKPTTQPSSPVDATTAIANFERGNQALAGEFLYQLYLTRPGENFMISGFSVLIALAQLCIYAIGTTAEQILRLLNLNSSDEIRTVFPILIENYKSQKEVIFELAVKYYGDINYPFSDKFLQDSEDIFGSKPQSLDFADNEEAADTINEWVEKWTHGLIKDLVKADMFSKDTRCVLANALYFLGNWEKQFNKNSTQPRDFYVDKQNSVLKDIMYQETRLEYAESDALNSKILKKRYKGGNFSLVVILPNELDGLPSVLETLREANYFNDILQSLTPQNVKFYLPRMDFDTDISDLPYLLQKVNQTEMFKTGSNNFENILKFNEKLYLSNAIQKTKLKVDETGTEAAAATAMIVGTTAVFIPPKDIIFNCDHPFAFYLLLNDFPMFYGVYSGHD